MTRKEMRREHMEEKSRKVTSDILSILGSPVDVATEIQEEKKIYKHSP